MLVEKLPMTALLRFYAQGAEQVFEVSGQEIMETIARNLAAGDTSDEARTYWSPVIDGQEITVEIDLPAGVAPEEVKFSIPRVSHLFSSPLNPRTSDDDIGTAGWCNLDSMCYPEWELESLATARMTYTEGGGSYRCTGTLMADSDPSTDIPYFLTANHCIKTQTVASTLQTYWFYRASSCNSGTLSPSTQTLTSGATLLYASSTTDTSFLRLNSPAPGGTWNSGSLIDLPVLGSPTFGLHNPHGDLQKFSFGYITDYANCTPSGGGFTCLPAPSGSAGHLRVVWSGGVTEGGSSGSGLWAVYGSSSYLVGQLQGGSSSCSAPTSPVYYGRFDVAYNAALFQWLGQPPPLILSTTFLPAGDQGAAYWYALQAEGGVPPYFWSLVSGKKNKLPPGLTLSADGTLTGIPTKAKTTTLGVQVTDAAGTSLARTLSIQIVKGVKFKAKLGKGKVGTPYSATLKATGGIAPLTFSLIGGALPPGLTLDPATGQISGTPAAAGTFNFQARVASNGGSSDQKDMRIKVK